MMVTDPFRSASAVHDPHEAGSGSWAGLIDGECVSTSDDGGILTLSQLRRRSLSLHRRCIRSSDGRR
jgi:hypothetical protein